MPSMAPMSCKELRDLISALPDPRSHTPQEIERSIEPIAAKIDERNGAYFRVDSGGVSNRTRITLALSKRITIADYVRCFRAPDMYVARVVPSRDAGPLLHVNAYDVANGWLILSGSDGDVNMKQVDTNQLQLFSIRIVPSSSLDDLIDITKDDPVRSVASEKAKLRPWPVDTTKLIVVTEIGS